MEHRTRNFVVAAGVAALVLTGESASGGEKRTLTLAVYISDQAGTERRFLDEAQAQASRIFKDVGVHLVWLDVRDEIYNPGCDPFGVVVTLLSPPMVQRLTLQGMSERALGSAASAAGRATVHPARIHALASSTRGQAGSLMGRVMAHEIGHLLLPEGHSHYGIMTAGMYIDPSGSARFTVPQTRAIRALLESKAAAISVNANCASRRAAAERD